MLRVDRISKRLKSLDTPTLADVSIMERYDLQEFIFRSAQDFFREIAEELGVRRSVHLNADVAQLGRHSSL